MTQQKILDLLAGRDSTRPMPVGTLLEKSGMKPDALKTLLDQMANSVPASINRASITKSGQTEVVVWPTGMIGVPQPFRVIQHQLVRRHELAKQQTQQQEPSMTTNRGGSQPSELRNVLLKKIIQEPGLCADSLVKYALSTVTSITEKQVRKTLANVVYTGYVVRNDDKGYYPAAGAESAAKVKPKASNPQPTPAKTETAQPEPVVAQPASDEVQPVPECNDFSVMLSDDNHLHISFGDEQIMLTPDQTERLHGFMHRIQLWGAQ